MFKRLLGMPLIFGAIVCAAPVLAQSPCGQRDAVVDRLETRYSEQLAGGGLQQNASRTAVVEIWASPETGTFTVLVTNIHGLSCIVATGTDFFTSSPRAEPSGTPS